MFQLAHPSVVVLVHSVDLDTFLICTSSVTFINAVPCLVVYSVCQLCA